MDGFRRRGGVLSIWALAGVAMVGAARGEELARVGESLRRDPAYAQYARMVIELDLLAKPTTASQPVTVVLSEAGTLAVRGFVESERLRRHILADARRISGLTIRDEMSSKPSRGEYPIAVANDELAEMTQQTLEGLFPDIAEQIRARVSENGVIVLHGAVDSFETKLLISQAIKSEPGCRAVVNLLAVPPDPKSGMLPVTTSRDLMVRDTDLPKVPPAPIADIEPEKPKPSIREMTKRVGAGAPAADDAPEGDLRDRSLREDVEAAVANQSKLSGENMVVDVTGGVITLTGKLKKREMVELAADTAAEVTGVTKVVVKGKPFVLQRTLPPKAAKKTQPVEKKWYQWISFQRTADADNPTVNRRLKEIVRRSIKRQCEKRLKELNIRETPKGLVIEGEVETNRDRSFVLTQIDSINELHDVPTDIILRVKEFK